MQLFPGDSIFIRRLLFRIIQNLTGLVYKDVLNIVNRHYQLITRVITDIYQSRFFKLQCRFSRISGSFGLRRAFSVICCCGGLISIIGAFIFCICLLIYRSKQVYYLVPRLIRPTLYRIAGLNTSKSACCKIQAVSPAGNTHCHIAITIRYVDLRHCVYRAISRIADPQTSKDNNRQQSF